ncbi:UNVERIFIED_CONTAM: hypothetical protein HHA_451420 [Hammondia hammondi]|eukprot:XP_008884228.1 hypothetical protein HHA_451420 [Hammondia hammondi]
MQSGRHQPSDPDGKKRQMSALPQVWRVQTEGRNRTVSLVFQLGEEKRQRKRNITAATEGKLSTQIARCCERVASRQKRRIPSRVFSDLEPTRARKDFQFLGTKKQISWREVAAGIVEGIYSETPFLQKLRGVSCDGDTAAKPPRRGTKDFNVENNPIFQL